MTGGTDSVILKYLLLSSPDLLSVGQGDTKLSNKGRMLDRSTKSFTAQYDEGQWHWQRI